LSSDGGILRSGVIARFPHNSTSASSNLGLGSWVVGPDFEWDGTNYYATFSVAQNSPDNLRGVLQHTPTAVNRIVERPSNTPWMAMTVAGGMLYFSDTLTGGGRAIKSVPTSGGTPVVVTTIGNISEARWRTMLVVGGTIYWAERGDGSASAGMIRSAPAAGGVATTHVSNLTPNVANMVSDGVNLYVNDGGSLRKYDLATFAATTLAENDDVVDIALDGPAVYWASNGSTREIKKMRK
jgi:hypothetical protein